MQRLKRHALRAVLLLGAALLFVYGLGLIFLVVFGTDPSRFTSSLGLAASILVSFSGAAGLFASFRRYGDAKVALPALDLSALGGLWRVYVDSKLSSVNLVESADNPYAKLTDAEVLDVCLHVNPKFPTERIAALFATVKRRVEVSYLPDGRLIPAELRAVAAIKAPAGATCAAHAEREAALACPRCGTFICVDCTSADRRHCRPCLELLIAPAK